MRTMICHVSAADKGPFRTVRCRKFATDERRNGSSGCPLPAETHSTGNGAADPKRVFD